jgi:hypothetical protein
MSIRGRIALMSFLCSTRAYRRLGQEHMACYFCHPRVLVVEEKRVISVKYETSS